MATFVTPKMKAAIATVKKEAEKAAEYYKMQEEAAFRGKDKQAEKYEVLKDKCDTRIELKLLEFTRSEAEYIYSNSSDLLVDELKYFMNIEKFNKHA